MGYFVINKSTRYWIYNLPISIWKKYKKNCEIKIGVIENHDIKKGDIIIFFNEGFIGFSQVIISLKKNNENISDNNKNYNLFNYNFKTELYETNKKIKKLIEKKYIPKILFINKIDNNIGINILKKLIKYVNKNNNDYNKNIDYYSDYTNNFDSICLNESDYESDTDDEFIYIIPVCIVLCKSYIMHYTPEKRLEHLKSHLNICKNCDVIDNNNFNVLSTINFNCKYEIIENENDIIEDVFDYHELNLLYEEDLTKIYYIKYPCSYNNTIFIVGKV